MNIKGFEMQRMHMAFLATETPLVAAAVRYLIRPQKLFAEKINALLQTFTDSVQNPQVLFNLSVKLD